jgi:hypothetical protein
VKDGGVFVANGGGRGRKRMKSGMFR